MAPKPVSRIISINTSSSLSSTASTPRYQLASSTAVQDHVSAADVTHGLKREAPDNKIAKPPRTPKPEDGPLRSSPPSDACPTESSEKTSYQSKTEIYPVDISLSSPNGVDVAGARNKSENSFNVARNESQQNGVHSCSPESRPHHIASSLVGRKVSRKATRKVSRKATRKASARRKQITDAVAGEFDDLSDVEQSEDVIFSETDSEENNDNSFSDESEIEFEEEIAAQLKVDKPKVETESLFIR